MRKKLIIYQYMLVSTAFYSYLHMKSGVVCIKAGNAAIPSELRPSKLAIASRMFSIPAPVAKFSTPIRSARTVYFKLFVLLINKEMNRAC